MCTNTVQVFGASHLNIPVLKGRVSPGVFYPGGINVQETRSSVPCHAGFGRGHELEDRSNGAQRRLCNYGERRITCADNAMEKRSITGTDRSVQERCIASSYNALVIA